MIGCCMPCNSRGPEEPEDADAELCPVVPEREVVDDAGAEEALKGAQEDAADELAGQVVGHTLQEARDGPAADAKGDPLRYRVSQQAPEGGQRRG